MQSRYVADYYYYYAGLADKIQGEVLPIDKPNLRVFTTREPIGVVTTIVPWNAQLFLSATKIAPALAAGNTVVIKASEQAPAPLFKLAELIDKVGFPKGVINIITGFGEPCGRVLTSHPKVARVAFTGGCEVAKQIVKNTAENFAYLSLELGGKSPIVVFDDCDLEGAVLSEWNYCRKFWGIWTKLCCWLACFYPKNIYSKVLKKIKERAAPKKLS